jgi:hypothetical protein
MGAKLGFLRVDAFLKAEERVPVSIIVAIIYRSSLG